MTKRGRKQLYPLKENVEQWKVGIVSDGNEAEGGPVLASQSPAGQTDLQLPNIDGPSGITGECINGVSIDRSS